MRLIPFLAALALPLLTLAAAAPGPEGNRVLVVLDEGQDALEFSEFYDSLKARGYNITERRPKESSPEIFSYDERKFDHIVFLSPSAKSFAPDLSPQSLVEHLRKSGNLLLTFSPYVSEHWRDFAREFSLELEPRGTSLLSSFDSVPSLSSPAPHQVLAIPPPAGLTRTPILSNVTLNSPHPILFRGQAHAAETHPLLVPVLHAPRGAWSFEPESKEGVSEAEDAGDEVLKGSRAKLISAFQTRNNARVVFVGSTDLFGDELTKAEGIETLSGKKHDRSSNALLRDDLTKWAFQESGVVKVTDVKHHKEGATEVLDRYRIKDDIVYEIALSTREGDKWVPFVAHDVQLEFTMLDPHVRTTLVPARISEDGTSQVYEAHFRVPDRHGVFTFRVNYKRDGLTFVEEKSQVSVTPFRHDEYPRFISAAWPYYGGALSTIAGFLVFSALWLGSRFGDEGAKKKWKKAE